ncbi:MAG: adenylosuccinate lyase [Saprospiraceae bacterium]|nr:adenylosuccinate lyase [Saprospiraceae bacterium]MBK9632804.1 adenylosuccinate lyase [Saprospiraceae bacterium]
MSLQNISPIDGRYANKVSELSDFFSEHGLFKYRVQVEVLYLLELIRTPELSIPAITKDQEKSLLDIVENYSIKDSERIKEIEKITRHDVKAVEYFLREKIGEIGLQSLFEMIHFGLTSQDINNTATPMMMRDATKSILIPHLSQIHLQILAIANEYRNVSMLARTHGQPASPTGLGKEIAVFTERLQKQIYQLEFLEYSGKFGGATGNFNAHKIAYPQLDWRNWADHFLLNKLGIKRQSLTTQIAHYDEIAEWCHILMRINTIFIDFCKDLWAYISMDYFTQKTVAGEVGSSAMPHKVNPIDFENAEGNFGIANAIFSFMAEKLPISRLQRDLTDSTVLRNLGTPVAHSLIALKSLSFGLTKLEVNLPKIESELNQQWIILAEAVQTILRRENIEHPYELLKNLTRGKSAISPADLHTFVDGLQVSDAVKEELKALSPEGYIGYAGEF